MEVIGVSIEAIEYYDKDHICTIAKMKKKLHQFLE
jgi:hypothetical protein